MAKTDWKLTDTVRPEDMNQIGKDINALSADNSVTDNQIGDRTISDAGAPTGDKGKVTVLFGWLANMIKTITGKSNWRTAPRTTLENAVKRDGDELTGNLRITRNSASLNLRTASDTSNAFIGVGHETATGATKWISGMHPNSGRWGVYDNAGDRWGLYIEPTLGTDEFKYRNNSVYHAGNHGNTGDPHTQYAPKSNPTFTGTVTMSEAPVSTFLSAHTVAKPSDTNGFMRAVILLHPMYNGTNIDTNYCVGDFFAHRGATNTNGRAALVSVNSHSAYQQTRVSLSAQSNSTAERYSFVTCTYEGVKYVALSIAYGANNYANGIYFEGYARSSVGRERLKYIEYYNEQTSTATHPEINGSIAPIDPANVQFIEAAAFLVNGSNVMTQANHGGLADPHTQYLLKTGGTITGNTTMDAALTFPARTASGLAASRQMIFHYRTADGTLKTNNFLQVNTEGTIAYYRDGSGAAILTDANHNSTGNPHGQYALLTATPQNQYYSGDLNNLVKAGMHRLQQTHGNAPPGVYAYGNILVLRGPNNADTITQVIFPYQGASQGNVMLRSGSPPEVGGGSTWNPWIKMWTEGNHGAGSGLHADLLDGYHANLNDVANTVAVRDGGGSITTKTFKSTATTTAGGAVHLLLHNTNSLRFAVGLTDLESGSNSGSNLGVYRYKDDGTYLGLAFTISRENGGAYFDNVLSASRLISRIGQGTAPLTVSSTTRVANLNADMLDDCHATSVATPNTVAIRGAQGTLKAAAPQTSDDVVTKGWFEGAVIQPTKPRTADLVQAGATSQTYYTLLDVTGAGILSRVVLASTTLNYNLTIRVTVDGVVSNLTPGGTMANSARGLQHTSGTGSYSAMYSLDFFTELVFFRSLKVEVMHSHTSTVNLHASADYALK
ncbi:hypothetical protein D3P09_11785 [Paenibacillus pinisoli]|uniref:Uncharacterized protein n=1 Tax=Paenibacillus pinisoli TaxID=1276110 RepID=A0A3A6PPB6_9BACL|nr:hypothetical protein [Paenibacillus pinisoli]RJX40049.1 hypothetical protein D3P09_11785 [Paenibacillus pinisoli]